MAALDPFDPAVQAWFTGAFFAPTAVQERGWGPIAARDHTLLLAPTGSGKTLAAFLMAIDRLVRLPVGAEPGVRVLYVSPLKALVYDIERNLRAPLVGIANAASRAGRTLRDIRVDVRTGDTSARDRRQQLRQPADVLVTTPESLFLLLGSGARDTLARVDTVIVDEIHAMAGSKRGVHLALSLERLSDLAAAEPQRVGLSATQRPLEEIARFLGGDREVSIVDASGPPRLDVQIIVPVDDMEHPTGPPTIGGGEGMFQQVGGGVPQDTGGPDRLTAGMWPAIYPELLKLIRAHRSTIVFTNSRLLCERLAKRLNELAGEELVSAHHGSLSHDRRAQIEESLKAGTLPAIVATSSLELGIDMGAVDLVILVESPGSVASGLQRVGRAGHSVGRTSIGRIFPKYRGDLVEAAVVAQEMLTAAVESTRVPKNCLDVLAQQVVAMTVDHPWKVDALLARLQRAYPYRDLTPASLASVLDMLSGRYPSDDFADLQPRIVWDRSTDELTPRKGARTLTLLNAGTIPDRGLYGVFVAGDGPRLGELDEEMVYESRKGDLIILGASTWRIEEITRDQVLVSPAPGQPGRLPFWHGERPGRPVELGRKVGALVRAVTERKDAADWLQRTSPMDARAAKNIVAYVRDQIEAAGAAPTDRTIVVESFRDELGDWRMCVLTPFGARVHAPWALALEAFYAGKHEVQALWTDDGLSLRFADTEDPPDPSELWIDPEEIEDRVVDQLGRSALFAARFRENAARSLLLPRKTVKGRVPLWAQRLRSQNLLQVASQYPAFPAVLETYRECLQDVLDVPSLIQILSDVRSRAIRVHEVVTRSPSPFARSLVFAYVAAFMYQGDAPLAERRAMALTLDRALLRELLGQEELRELLDPGAVAEVEAELQCRAPERWARSADGVHDLLRRLGDLSEVELAERCEPPFRDWLGPLEVARRILPVRIAGEVRWIAVEDAARFRDAVGVVLPAGLPQVFLAPAPDALETLVARYARTHGPFHTRDLVARWGLPVGPVSAALRALLDAGRLDVGDIRPGGTEPEWCDPEVLRRLKRRTLAALREEIAPVEPEIYARFLAQWHGIGSDRGGLPRLREVVQQLEGMPILASALEEKVLPTRSRGFSGDELDALGAMGEVVWVGCGAAGPKDGHVALYRRDRIALLRDAPEVPPLEPVHRALYEHLVSRGASFVVALQIAVEAPTATVVSALWDLVWAGLVTNDTFHPLRALRARQRPGRAVPAVGGRWSAVRDLFAGAHPTDTERAYARAAMLLERYGVACGSAARAEGLPGGYSSVYPVLKAMEDGGRTRRGWFVEGVDGAQFALPGVVDRLRASRDDEGVIAVMDAADPASPWGALLSWPARAESGPGPRRVAGATVVSVGGRPVLYLEKGEKSWVVAPGAEPEKLLAAARGWLAAKPDRWKTVRLDRVDGGSALDHPLRDVFVEAGFVASGVGLQYVRR